MKLDTKEIASVLSVIDQANPDFYMDIHVTDGVDFQYDVTYAHAGNYTHSPSISFWFSSVYVPSIAKGLTQMGHIPGPYLDPANGVDFSEGIAEYPTNPNFSNAYADLRHLPGLLVENHSLKPYKQRVLGAYVLIEETMKVIGETGGFLQKSISSDRLLRPEKIPVRWVEGSFGQPAKDSLVHLGIKSKREISPLTGTEVVRWLGIKETKKLPFYPVGKPFEFIPRPKGYWVPLSSTLVIEKLNLHGIKMNYPYLDPVLPDSVKVTQSRIRQPVFSKTPFEGRFQVTGKPEVEKKTLIPDGKYVFVSTDQPLGDLAVVLLDPSSPASFLQWGFFNTIFQKTEYAEPYFLEPMAMQMMDKSPSLKAAFEEKKKAEPDFAKNAGQILNWFYSQSPYFDPYYQLYPVFRED